MAYLVLNITALLKRWSYWTCKLYIKTYVLVFKLEEQIRGFFLTCSFKGIWDNRFIVLFCNVYIHVQHVCFCWYTCIFGPRTWSCLFYCPQLFLEGVRAKQSQDALLLEKNTMEKEIRQANASLDFYEMKAARIEEQVCPCEIF